MPAAAEIVVGIAAGAHRLDLQGLQRPAVAHLIGDHALEIGLQIHDVHHSQIAAADAFIAEPTVIAVALEPGADLILPSDVGHHPQGQAVPAVKLEQDLVRPRPGHVDPIAAGPGDGPLPQAGLGVLSLLPGGVGPAPDLVFSIDPGGKAIRIVLRRPDRLLIGGAGLHLKVIAADHRAAIVGIGIGGAADPGVLGLDHGDPGLFGAGPAQLHKVQIPVEVAQPVSGAVSGVVLQVGVDQCSRAIGQPHLDRICLRPGRLCCRQEDGGKPCKDSLHRISHFSVSY